MSAYTIFVTLYPTPVSTVIARLRLLFACSLLIFIAVPCLARPGDKPLNRPYADLRRWHLGFSVGMHLQDLEFTHNGYVTPEGEQWFVEVPSYSPGVCVNVLADLRLGKHFNLRLSPGMYFGSKTATLKENESGSTERQDIKTTYVVMPLDLKISGDRYKNSRPYVTLGAMPAFDIGKKRSEFLKMKSFDTFLTFGLGCDFYLPFFKLNPEIKFCLGLTDVLQHDRPDLADNPSMKKITDSIRKLKSKMFVLTFYFE